MIAEATRYEKLLKANGAGAFSKIEYADERRVVLRTSDVKTADLSGTVRVYFDGKREQVMTGRRFDPMGSGLILLRPGMFYRVYTTLEFVEPIPSGVSALVVLTDEANDVVMTTTAPLREGYVGPVMFTIQPFRRIEMDKMTSIAHLMFFEDTVALDDEWLESLGKKVLAKVKPAAPKKANSVRTKKSTKKSEPEAPEEEVTEDASHVSDEHPDDAEG